MLTPCVHQAPAAQPDPIIGEWRWSSNVVVKITADAKISCPTMGGTWEFTNNKEIERKYVLKWDKDLLIDSVALSRDGKRLAGKNSSGVRVTAEKIDRQATVAQATPVPAPLPLAGGKQQTMKGNFYVSVDDEATIYVNGRQVYTAPLNESRSPDLELTTTDRVVVHLRNTLSGHRFMMVFASSDLASIISFRVHDFKLVPEVDVTDFNAQQFARWNKQAKSWKSRSMLPVKCYSDWLWGDSEDCTIACNVTPAMFSQKPK